MEDRKSKVEANKARMENMRSTLLDAVSIAYKDFGFESFGALRKRIYDSRSIQELTLIGDMMVAISRIADGECADRGPYEDG